MNSEPCIPNTPPVVVFATHEELLRSARDIWAVAVSLLTELTPDKFATAPWAAGLFTVELPFILSKLWHIQQGLLSSAHSYMQTESMLTTVLESIDVSKLFSQLTTWVVDLQTNLQLPIGLTQHVSSVHVPYPTDVNIIKQRFNETTWSNQVLLRHETYVHENHAEHWFYLPKGTDWDVINGKAEVSQTDGRLSDYIHQVAATKDQVFVVAEKDGELFIPDYQSNDVQGEVVVLKVN